MNPRDILEAAETPLSVTFHLAQTFSDPEQLRLFAPRANKPKLLPTVACSSLKPCPIRLAYRHNEPSSAHGFFALNQYRDHLHPTFEGRLTPAAQEIQIFAEDLFVLAVD